MTNLETKKLELLEAMLDERCDVYGTINTIQYLLDRDFTKEDLLQMDFAENDVNAAIEADEDAAYEEAYDGYYENPYEEEKPEIRYEVWALGFDEDDFCTDTEVLLGTFENKEEAINRAKMFDCINDVKKATKEDLKLAEGDYIQILVETIKNDDPCNANIDTAFVRVIA